MKTSKVQVLDKTVPDPTTVAARILVIDDEPIIREVLSDVIGAVKFGQESGLPVAVRSGGHSFPGHSVADDALMIDLQPMKGVRVDPEARTARVSAGCTQGDVDHATHAFGLAVPAGIISTTGIAGLTLTVGMATCRANTA